MRFVGLFFCFSTLSLQISLLYYYLIRTAAVATTTNNTVFPVVLLPCNNIIFNTNNVEKQVTSVCNFEEENDYGTPISLSYTPNHTIMSIKFCSIFDDTSEAVTTTREEEEEEEALLLRLSRLSTKFSSRDDGDGDPPQNRIQRTVLLSEKQKLQYDDWLMDNIMRLCSDKNKNNNSNENNKSDKHRSSSSMIFRLDDYDNDNNIVPDVDYPKSSSSSSTENNDKHKDDDICLETLSRGDNVVTIVHCGSRFRMQLLEEETITKQQRNAQVTGALDWESSRDSDSKTISSTTTTSNNTTTIRSEDDENEDAPGEESEIEEEKSTTSSSSSSKKYLIISILGVVFTYGVVKYMKQREYARWQEYHTHQLLQAQDEAFDVSYIDEDDDELFGDGHKDETSFSDLELTSSSASTPSS